MACCCGHGVGGVLIRIAALAGIGLTVGMVHSMRVRLVAPEPRPAPVPVDVETPSDGTAAPLGFHITLEQARALFDEGRQFIDARPDHEYVLGTIPGAVHLTPGTFSTPEGANQLVYIGQDQPVVIFCSGGDCHDSENLAALMKDAGYTAIHIFTDGYPAWQSAGLETQVPGAPEAPGGN